MLGNLLVGNIGTHGGPIEVENGSADVGVASGAVERDDGSPLCSFRLARRNVRSPRNTR
jgi:hypothetical protein